MEKEFVPYEQAVSLKELGFDEPCLKEFHKQNLLSNSTGEEITNTQLIELYGEQDVISAPIYSQVFRFFREKHNLWSMVYPREGWNYSIQRIDENITCTQESFHSIEINTYKETELACLNRLIEIVKEKI
jgi:hypothetical protein